MQFDLFSQAVVTFPAKRTGRGKRKAAKRRSALVLPFPICRSRAFIAEVARHLADLNGGRSELPANAVDFWNQTVADLSRDMTLAGFDQERQLMMLHEFRDRVGVLARGEADAQVG